MFVICKHQNISWCCTNKNHFKRVDLWNRWHCDQWNCFLSYLQFLWPSWGGVAVADLYDRQTMSLLETCSKKGRFVAGGGRCPLVTAVAAARTGGILAVTKPACHSCSNKTDKFAFWCYRLLLQVQLYDEFDNCETRVLRWQKVSFTVLLLQCYFCLCKSS